MKKWMWLSDSATWTSRHVGSSPLRSIAGKADDQPLHLFGPVERQKMATALDRLHLGTGYQIAVMLALGRPRPVSIAPNQQNRHIDAVVVLGSRLPAFGVSQQADEGA